ncbi:MAG TPA: FMN reductase [Marmoricola sp.]|nr:FMN reductase [Marmoricola sp.]
MTPRTIVVVTAGLSEPSSTRLLADLLADAVRSEEVTTDVVELRPLAHALADNLLTGFATGELAEAQRKVAHADGLIVVTPVFSASYSGLFKMFFDVLEQGTLEGTPVLVAATAGTARHSLVLDHALRPLFNYLRAVVVPTAVFAAGEDWGSDGAGEQLRARIERAGAELVAAVRARPATERLDQFDRDLAAMGDFASLLQG